MQWFRVPSTHLVHSELETFEDVGERDDLDGQLARFGEGEVAEEDGGVERERIHVLSSSAVDLRGGDELSAEGGGPTVIAELTFPPRQSSAH